MCGIDFVVKLLEADILGWMAGDPYRAVEKHSAKLLPLVTWESDHTTLVLIGEK